MSPADLVTTREIGMFMGLTAERVRQLSHEPGFPEPVRHVGSARLWQWSDIEMWLARREHVSCSE